MLYTVHKLLALCHAQVCNSVRINCTNQYHYVILAGMCILMSHIITQCNRTCMVVRIRNLYRTHSTLPTHLLSQGHGSVIETVSIAVDNEPAPVPVSTLT